MLIESSRFVDFIVPLNHEITQFDRLLLPGTTLDIQLLRAPDSFVIMCPETNTEKYKIHIEELRLYYKTIKIQPQLCVEIEKKLQSSDAIYPINKTLIKNNLINSGVSNFYWTNLFEGFIPKLVLLTFVKNSAFNGKYSENPFHFRPFGLNECYFTVNGLRYPHLPWTPDFENKLYVREYSELLAVLGISPLDPGNQITHKAFADGMFFFGYDYSPEGCSGFHEHMLSRGVMDFSCTFKAPLTDAVACLAYAIYDTSIFLNKDRQISSRTVS
jgi:hypothetical protein